MQRIAWRHCGLAHWLGQFIPLHLIYGSFVSQHPTCIASTLLSLFLYLNSLFSSQAVLLSVTNTDSLALVTLLVFVQQTGLLPAPWFSLLPFDVLGPYCEACSRNKRPHEQACRCPRVADRSSTWDRKQTWTALRSIEIDQLELSIARMVI